MTNEEFQELVLIELRGLKEGQKNLEIRLQHVETGQQRIEAKIDKLSVIQNDDIVALVKTTSEIKHNVNHMQKDVLYIVERTADNSKQILSLVK